MAKEKMIARSITFPESLIKEFQAVADQTHDGNFSMAARDAMRLYIAEKSKTLATKKAKSEALA